MCSRTNAPCLPTTAPGLSFLRLGLAAPSACLVSTSTSFVGGRPPTKFWTHASFAVRVKNWASTGPRSLADFGAGQGRVGAGFLFRAGVGNCVGGSEAPVAMGCDKSGRPCGEEATGVSPSVLLLTPKLTPARHEVRTLRYPKPPSTARAVRSSRPAFPSRDVPVLHRPTESLKMNRLLSSH
jgi:hypothetical protein